MKITSFGADKPPSSYFQDLIGFSVIDWRVGTATVVLEIKEGHLNRGGTVHGGAISTLIDAACGLSGNFPGEAESLKQSITLTLVTNFISSVKSGCIRAVGTKRGGGGRIFFSSAEVFDEDGTLVATGSGTFSLTV